MQAIRDLIDKAVGELGTLPVEFGLEHPKDESHGDYSTNVAMVLAKNLGQNPRELAETIVGKINKGPTFVQNFEKVEVAGPGFINFYLKSDFFLAEAKRAVEPDYGKNSRLKGRATMVEFTDPNPFKEFHIGHLMSNTVGESLARLFAASGATVKRANYQGDVGLHVAKSVWGMQKLMAEQKLSMSDLQGQALQARQQFMGKAYAYGATKYETDETAKLEMNALNKVIYDKSEKEIDELYQAGRKWSLEYFETIYSRLGTKFDEYFFESEAGEVGLKVIEEGLKKKVLEEGDGGAIVFRGEKYGLHTRVFRNKLGLPTYEGKELGLAKTKYERYKYDKSYIVTANEIDEYFKVLIQVMNLLYPELGKKTTHLSHGMMKLTSGKMSSRTGKVVTGEGLLDELKEVVEGKMGDRSFDSPQDKERIADSIAVAALKYTVLKQAIGGDIVYEPETITNMEGATGPFIQYTHARAKSILRKVKSVTQQISLAVDQLKPEEVAILRWLYRYPEVIAEASEKYAPHLVATYLFELSSRFNSFYQSCRVEENGEVNPLRYLLTQASANVIASGLNILGIEAPEEM